MADSATSATIDALFSEAERLWNAADPAAALEVYETLIKRLGEDGDPALRLRAECGRALCQCELGDLSAALARYPDLLALCHEHRLNDHAVLRQWAKALEQSGDFVGARARFEQCVPDATTPPLEALKWHHALGLLDWRDGRLAEAREHLGKAAELMPEDPHAAVGLLAVLGNTALLCIELGDIAQAYRLADRMIALRAQVRQCALSSEVNLVRVRAALAKHRGDFEAAACIYKDGLEKLDDGARTDWARRLDLSNDYVEALLASGPNPQALDYLSELAEAAPHSIAWIGRFFLARVLIAQGETEAARGHLAETLAAFLGSGSAESEVGIVMELARFCACDGRPDAAILLSKLALKYLADLGQSFEGEALVRIVKAGAETAAQAAHLLHGKGRFDEAAFMQNQFERIQMRALFRIGERDGGAGFHPVPFLAAEQAVEARWDAGRARLRACRASQPHAACVTEAQALIDEITALALPDRPPRPEPQALPRPGRGAVRLYLTEGGDSYQLSLVPHDPEGGVRFEVDRSAFNLLVAELRENAADIEAWKAPAAALFDLIFAPARHMLDGATRLEIDARGVLGKIPFSLLFDGARCLVQHKAITYLVAGTPGRSRAARRGLLQCSALSNGADLSGAAAASLAPITQLGGADFTRDRFLSALRASPQFLSVATHLDCEPTRPEHWALWLGSEEPLYLRDFGGPDFDLDGISVALMASCASAVFEPVDVAHRSLASIMLDKGIGSFVGTLWDISAASAAFVSRGFWREYSAKGCHDASVALARLQARQAALCLSRNARQPATGGIGQSDLKLLPEDWATFAVFETCNELQPTDTAPPTDPDRGR